METLPTTFSAEAYFETQPPPSTIEQDVQSVRVFLKQQQEHRRKVVLVTVCISIALPQ
jgi:phosphopantothenate-cysteine ligase